MMFAAALILLAAALGAVVLALGARFFKQRRATLALANGELEELYRSAQALVMDDTVPESVASFVETYVGVAQSGKLASWMARDILSGAFFKKREPTEASKILRKDALSLTESQQTAYAKVITYGLLVSAASNFIWGEHIRRILLFAMYKSANGDQTLKQPKLNVEPPPSVDKIAFDFTVDCARHIKSRELAHA